MIKLSSLIFYKSQHTLANDTTMSETAVCCYCRHRSDDFMKCCVPGCEIAVCVACGNQSAEGVICADHRMCDVCGLVEEDEELYQCTNTRCNEVLCKNDATACAGCGKRTCCYRQQGMELAFVGGCGCEYCDDCYAAQDECGNCYAKKCHAHRDRHVCPDNGIVSEVDESKFRLVG